MQTQTVCPDCNGNGEVVADKCPECKGQVRKGPYIYIYGIIRFM